MPNKIVHKKSGTTGLVPAPGELDHAELAVNYADSDLYLKNLAGDAVVKVTHASNIKTTAAGNLAATNVQAALNELDSEKQPTITGGATTITSNNLTASRAIVSDANGKVAVATTTAAEIDYVNGVTSAIQTQLNGKQATLVSNTNIKTVNSTSLLGSGDVAVQPTLVSGTNIKTVNDTSLLGSGNVAVQPLTNGLTDIGAALVDDDELPVYDTSATANRKSALSRLWTYLSGKLMATANTFTAAQTISVNIANPALKITQAGAGDCLVVEDIASDTTPFLIDGNGRIISGSSAVYTGLFGGPADMQLSNAGYALALGSFSASDVAARLDFVKSRNTTVGSHTAILNNDDIGAIVFGGSDGASYITSSWIKAEVDGDPGTNDMPGRLVFSTTADGASSPTEAMRITSAQRVSIGAIVSPLSKLHVRDGTSGADNAAVTIDVNGGDVNDYAAVDMVAVGTNYLGSIRSYVEGSYLSNMRFYTAGATNTLTERMRINSGGNILIATTTDNASGAKLQVNGAITAGDGSASLPSYSNSDDPNTGMYFPAADTVGIATGGTERIRVGSAGNVGIGSAPPDGYTLYLGKNVTGAVSSFIVGSFGTVQSDVTTEARCFTSGLSTVAESFTLADLRHYAAFQGNFGVNSSVTNQVAFYAGGNLIGATNNYGFYSNIPAAAGRWNFYANGTAQNYFGGNVILKLASSVTPANNGELMIEATSNTQLTFKYKGSDGVVRSASLTLA